MVGALVALLASVAVPAVASAAGEYEPNDRFDQATGPMVGGRDYDAGMETANDVDFFYLNTSGQRQLDISVTGVSGCGLGHSSELQLLDEEGDWLAGAGIRTNTDGSSTSKILYSSPGRAQYVLRVEDADCRYRLRVEPASALTQESPGVRVRLGGRRSADDVQSVLLNGQVVATSPGDTAREVELGPLPPGSRIGVDAANSSNAWAWDFTVSVLEGRTRRVLLTETQEGGSGTLRAGLVRHVVLDPAGNVLESCGEAVAPATCFPRDDDGDGSAQPQDCDDSAPAIRPGAPEVLDNDVDENCDGVVQRRVRAASSISLKRKRATYSGRVASGYAPCVGGRRVVLRRRGSGTRSFGSATTRANGTYTVRRARRLRGRVYAVVTGRSVGVDLCRLASSRTIRG